jgi:hypothetical protein
MGGLLVKRKLRPLSAAKSYETGSPRVMGAG